MDEQNQLSQEEQEELYRDQLADAREKSKQGVASQAVRQTGQMASSAVKQGTKKATGAGLEVAGKAGRAVSKGVTKAGEGMMRVGSRMSGTGAGALVGVPLAGAGAVVAGAGKVGELGSKGVEAAGKGLRQKGQPTGAVKSPLAKQPGQEFMDIARKLRQMKQQAAQAQGGVAAGAVDVLAQKGTARALQWSWFTLIPTFGLSILYIDFHFVAHYFLKSEKFCAFGQEWNMLKEANTQVPEQVSAGVEMAEIGAMIFLNIVIAIAVLLLVSGGIFLSCFIENPLAIFDQSACSTFGGGSSGGAGASGAL